MSNSRVQSPQGFMFYLGTGIGYLLVFALRMVFEASKLLLKALVAGFAMHRKFAAKRKETVQTLSPESVVEVDVKVESAGHDFSNYDPAAIRCIQFPKIGFLSIWAYREKGVVKRTITFTEARVAKQVGYAKLPLPDMDWPSGSSLAAVEDACIDDARRMIMSKVELPSEKAGVTKTTKAEKVAVAPLVSEQAKVATKKPVAKAYAHVPVKERHVGILQGSGVMERSMGKRKFNQFGIDVMDPAVGQKRVWGEDLSRAMEAAGAEPGDEVEVIFTGRSPRDHGDGGDAGHINHYTINVLQKGY